MTTDDESEAANRMQAAFEAVHEAVLRLLQEGEHDPQHLVLALAGHGRARGGHRPAGGMEGRGLLDDLAEPSASPGGASGGRERLGRCGRARDVLRWRPGGRGRDRCRAGHGAGEGVTARGSGRPPPGGRGGVAAALPLAGLALRWSRLAWLAVGAALLAGVCCERGATFAGRLAGHGRKGTGAPGD